jgi:hypothetical protein
MRLGTFLPIGALLATAMFFAGFLVLLVLEELVLAALCRPFTI